MQIAFELQSLAPWVAIAVSVAAAMYARKKDKSAETDQRFARVEENLSSKAAKDTVTGLANKIDAAEEKITRIEVELEHLPDKNTVLELAKEVSKLSGDVAVLAERVKPIANMSDRMQEAILDKVMSS